MLDRIIFTFCVKLPSASEREIFSTVTFFSIIMSAEERLRVWMMWPFRRGSIYWSFWSTFI